MNQSSERLEPELVGLGTTAERTGPWNLLQRELPSGKGPVGTYLDTAPDDPAVADFTESLRLDPSGGDGMIVYWRRGLRYRASKEIDKTLEDANALSRGALQWATAGDSKDSDSDAALTAARFGSEIFDHQRPYQLEVLAATKARAGDFSGAVDEQRRAMKLLTPATEDQRPAMQARLDVYAAGKPLPRE